MSQNISQSLKQSDNWSRLCADNKKQADKQTALKQIQTQAVKKMSLWLGVKMTVLHLQKKNNNKKSNSKLFKFRS